MTTRHRWLIASLLALGTAAALGAQATGTGQTITFDDAIRIALQQNNSIKAAQNATVSDAAAVQEARLQFLPDLRVNGSTSEDLSRASSLGGGTAGQLGGSSTQSLGAGVSSSLTLFDGFRNASSLRQAQATEQASRQDLARARQTVVFNVASDFLSLVTQQQQLEVQQQSLTAQQALEHEIQVYVNAGERPISDLYQQQASVANAQAAVVDGQRAVELSKVDLIQVLQLDPAGSYDFQAPSVNTDTAGVHYDLDSLITRALNERADVAAQVSLVGAAEQGVKAADAAKYPTVSLTAGYNTTYNSALSTGLADQLGQRQGGSLGIGVSIPLFDRGAAQADAERAQVQADDARLALATARQGAALDVRRAYLDYQSARQRLSAAEAQQKAADMALSATQQRYEAGKATLVEVTQSRTAQVQAATALVSARYNLVFEQALMSYYTGDLDPAHVKLG